MHGSTSARLMGGLILATFITLLASDPPAVFGQKKPAYQQADASKKVHPIAPTLPEGQKLTAEQLAKHFDTFISKRLKDEKADSSPKCNDEEFLRRVYLDITGKIPTAEKVVAFLDSKESDKRAKLIDELLATSDYGRHQADIWQSLLLPRNGDNRRFVQYYPHMVKWLEEKFNANTSWDKMVHELMTATGEVNKTGPVVYWLANPSADKVNDSISKLFLGVQLQCAQCHNHPFTDWKQDEYWGMAAFFLKVRPEGNPRAAAKDGKSIRISENNAKKGKKGAMLPESAKILPPKFLQGERPKVSSTGPVRPVLADWMTNAKNPFFAKAMVNRTLYQLFGRGIVNPVDDMHEGNAASHPELLADLSQQFVANGFDVKYLIRAICNSETYQRTSKPHGNNAEHGPEVFARMAIKPLSPEQMNDALTQLMGNGGGRGQGPRAKGPAARGGQNGREGFVSFFSAEEGADPTEYHTGIPQVLRLMNSPQFNNASAIGPILRSSKKPGEVIEKLYLTVLARRPTTEEVDRIQAYLRKHGDDQRLGMAGVLWVLMNSSEFAMNR